MPRPRVLAPLLALLALRCGGGDQASDSGFASGQVTTPGQVSFGSEGSDSSSATPTTTGPDTDPGTSTSSTGSTSTTEAGSTSTGAPTTSSATSTGPDSSTGPDLSDCGDGVVQDGEACDDGNRSDADACLNDCTAGTAVLALVGLGVAPASAATFTPGIGWKLSPFQIGVVAADLETTPEGAMAVVRRASAKVDEQDELFYARWQPEDPALFGIASEVGDFGFAKGAVSLAAAADTVNLAFLGSDNKHYTALWSPQVWGPFGKLPAGMIQIQAFGPSPATLAAAAPATYAVYAGDDAQLYYSHKAAPGAIWEASAGAPPLELLATVSPVAVVDEEADLIVAYVRKDGRLALIKLLTPMNAWTAEVLVHAEAITGSAIALLQLDAGGYALAWRGFDTQGIYLSRSTGAGFDKWAAPVTVEVPKLTSTPPLLIPGVSGAELEILFTTGAKLRHARMTDDQIVPPIDVPGVVAVTTVAATRVRLVP
jgi:cysteine-rich repeat protein